MDYVSGFMLGLTLQLSLGPVFFAVLHKALTEGSREAFKMTSGVAIIDALYIGLSFTGMALLLQVEILRNTVLVAGAAVLLLFGVRYYRKAYDRMATVKIEAFPNGGPVQGSGATVNPGSSSLAYGLKLTAVNPLTIVFWSGTFGGLLASGILNSTREALFYASGCISATLLFLGAVSMVAPFIPLRRSHRMEVTFDIIVGTVLVAFSIIMLSRL